MGKVGDLTTRVRGIVTASSTPAVLDQAIVSGTSFVSAVIIGRLSSVDAFGTYVLGTSLIMFAQEVQAALVSTPLMIRGPQLDETGFRKFAGNSIVHSLMIGGFCLVLAALGSLILPLLGRLGPSVGTMLLGLAVASPAILLREQMRRIFFQKLELAPAMLLDGSVALLQCGGLLYLGSTGHLTAATAYLVVGAATGSMVALSWLRHRSELTFDGGGIRSQVRYSWEIGRWVLASAVLWSVGMQFYPWILAAYHGSEAAGIWGACVGVTAVASVPMLGIQNLLGPKIAISLSEDGHSGLANFIRRWEVLFPSLMLLPLLVLVPFGNQLVTLLYGSPYGGHGWEVVLIAAGLIPAAAAFTYSRGLFALEHARVDFKVNFVPLGFLLSGGILLVSWFGTIGAAAALLASHTASAGTRRIAFGGIVHTGMGSVHAG